MTLTLDLPLASVSVSNPLREFVLARLDELDISSNEAARRSDKISFETMRAIIRGTHGGRLRPTVVEGLAEALGVPVKKVWDAMGVEHHGPWDWPRRFEALDIDERNLVEDVAAKLLAARNKGTPRP